ncbi:uncharacterized protein AB675_9657 [Cyphellophora attinorum]|uniref:Uncharacterized protein n=1 Tax=Cyphellophora attinorum TaxID=1664694 RepID=A0A0N0NP97_9EURO|nr:uncharacterized protein AB675_9657 [Phialophora attinorum]KPI42501.1 hypothetical protein AB675_9657 [Phialophora attinorum]
MEAAPLSLAQTHARNAALETKRSNPVAASEEHDLAAAEFATAAKGSSDQEAVRILNLLEQHHKKLGHILKTAHEKPAIDEQIESTPVGGTSKPPRLSRTPRETTRELSSSIASNLASARGIRGAQQKRSAPISPLVSNQHADGQLSHDMPKSRAASQATGPAASKPSWAPPVGNVDDVHDNDTASDSPFQLFYNTYQGLVSKMSAPLAFAGLPLAQAIPEEKQNTVPKASSQTERPTSTAKDRAMDYSRLISNAAFRAVSTNTTNDTPAKSRIEDSFYHVPTAGGTMSYAEMVNRADREEARTLRHHRQTSNLSNISENDDFVDASSTIIAQANSHAAQPQQRSQQQTGRPLRQLSLENATLRHLSDKMSKRLHAFEMASQTSTAALAQSIRSMPRSPLMSPDVSRAGAGSRKPPTTATDKHQPYPSFNKSSAKSTTTTDDRITELEEILRKNDARLKKKEAENEKLKVTVDKYKEKWDSLKAGARARRERQQGTSAAPEEAEA